MRKYAISTVLHLLSGLIIMFGMWRTLRDSPISLNPSYDFFFQFPSDSFTTTGLAQGYDIVTFIAVVLFRSEPANWPPLLDKPWLSTSLHDLWGTRWHQLFRRSFLLGGGYPFAAILRPSQHKDPRHSRRLSPGAIAFGTFIVSGLLHKWDYYALSDGRMPGHPTVVFFVLQPCALALEREWKRQTGRPVGGILGWFWVAFWLLIVAQPCGMLFFSVLFRVPDELESFGTLSVSS